MTGNERTQPESAAPSVFFSSALVIAFILFSLNLRGPITAIPPLAGQIHTSLGITLVTVGLLTSIPILCFGVLSPLVSWLISLVGINAGVILMLLLTALGTLIRPYTGIFGMIGGTFVIGTALAMGNILGLLIIGQYFPARSSLMTGVFTAAFNVGGMLFSALSMPIAAIAGWQFSLASWVWLPLLTLAAWALVIRGSRSTGDPTQSRDKSPSEQSTSGSLLHSRTAWILVVAMSAHLFVYFSLTAWIAAYMVDVAGVSEQKAGLISGIYQAASVIGAFLFPVLSRHIRLEKLLIVIGALWFTIPVMMLLIPHYWGVWSLVGGTNNGMAFVTILVLIIKQSRNMDENRRMSSMVQGIGFTVAAIGPVGIGYIRHTFNSWGYALAILMAFALVVSAAGLVASANKQRVAS